MLKSALRFNKRMIYKVETTVHQTMYGRSDAINANTTPSVAVISQTEAAKIQWYVNSVVHSPH